MSLSETVDPGGIDTVVSSAMEWLRAVTQERRVTLPGSPEGELHESLSPEGARRLVGRAWDLSQAYKRLPASPSEASLTVIAVWDPTQGKMVYFETLACGFGALRTVMSFNWTARALRYIIVVGMLIPISHYFDDYPCVVPEAFAEVARIAVEGTMEILGWDLKEPKPAEELEADEKPMGSHGFAATLSCLGVRVKDGKN